MRLLQAYINRTVPYLGKVHIANAFDKPICGTKVFILTPLVANITRVTCGLCLAKSKKKNSKEWISHD